MANDRIASFLNAASNGELGLSYGGVYRFCKYLSEKVKLCIEHLETELLNQKVVSTEATVVTVNEKQKFIRNFSIGTAVIYRAMKDKTLNTMHKLHFLVTFTGILLHNHETALYYFGTDRGECNVHIYGI